MKKAKLTTMRAGRNGQLAWELREELTGMGAVSCVGRPQIDLLDQDSVRDGIRSLQPAIVISAAAYRAVEQVESEPELAMKVNAAGRRAIAEETRKLGALFVTYSSDFVFAVKKDIPCLESDPANPLNVYGATKLAGDNAAGAVNDVYLICQCHHQAQSRR